MTELQVIFKYGIPAQTRFALSLPKGAEILHVDTQLGDPMMWVRHDRATIDTHLEQREFQIVGTGYQEIDPSSKYIGTWMQSTFVFHLFEITHI